MKLVVGFAVLITATAANAQPSLTPVTPAVDAEQQPSLATLPTPAPAEQPHAYLGLGLVAGGDAGGLYLDPALELGYQISPSWWAHGFVLGGGNAGTDEMTRRGSRVEVGGGVEARRCVFGGAVCGLLGADLAFRHALLDAENDHVDINDVILIEHVALDVGGDRVRYRAGLQASEDRSIGLGGIADGLALTNSVVIVF